MKGKELAKLLQCIIDEQKIKWGRDSLHPDEQTYCALGLLAKGAGLSDDEIDDDSSDVLQPSHGPLGSIPVLNDEAESFLDFVIQLSKSKLRYPIKGHLRKLKAYARRYRKEQEEGI